MLRFCVSASFLGQVLDLNANLIFFFPIPGLQLSIGKLKIVVYRVFLEFKLMKLERGSQENRGNFKVQTLDASQDIFEL